MKACSIALYLLLAFITLLTGFFSKPVRSAGREYVQVISVENYYAVACPSEKKVSCSMKLKYRTTFKKKDGTSGVVMLSSRTTAKYITVNFCPSKQQGLPEEPCPQQP